MMKKIYKYNGVFHHEFDCSKMHETKSVYIDTGFIEMYTKKPHFAWCCKYCLKERRMKYIATGHDHTDYSYDVCDCKDAAKTGKHWNRLN